MKRENVQIDFVVENPNFYRIVWKSRTEDEYGIGAYAESQQDALRSVKELNNAYPEYNYWAEPNPGLN